MTVEKNSLLHNSVGSTRLELNIFPLLHEAFKGSGVLPGSVRGLHDGVQQSARAGAMI